MDTATLIAIAEANARFLHQLLADATDITRQFPNVPNHPAWIVGHLGGVRLLLAGLLGAPVTRSSEYAAVFGPGSTPVADASKYPSKADLLASFDTAQQHLIAALKNATPALLAATNPIERLRAAAPTIGDAAARLIGSHDGLHIGQLTVWRRAAGLRPVIG